MHHVFPRFLVAIFVALGLTLTGFAATATASSPTAGASVSSNARADGHCAKQKRHVQKEKRQVKHSQKKVKHSKKKVRNADSHQQKKKAKKHLKQHKRSYKKNKSQLKRAKKRYHQCRQASPSQQTPIQALCDAGAPQTLCDQLGSLPGVGGTDNPFQKACDAEPSLQPVCDAIDDLGGIPQDPNDLADLIQMILDALPTTPAPRQVA